MGGSSVLPPSPPKYPRRKQQSSPGHSATKDVWKAVKCKKMGLFLIKKVVVRKKDTYWEFKINP